MDNQNQKKKKSHAAAFCCILEVGDAEEPSAAHAAVGHGARLGRALGALEAHYDTPARGARPARVQAVRESRPRRRALEQFVLCRRLAVVHHGSRLVWLIVCSPVGGGGSVKPGGIG
jgi:hypothetical protein